MPQAKEPLVELEPAVPVEQENLFKGLTPVRLPPFEERMKDKVFYDLLLRRCNVFSADITKGVLLHTASSWSWVAEMRVEIVALVVVRGKSL